jgi:tetratricopeptide (TPR) repeat protein
MDWERVRSAMSLREAGRPEEALRDLEALVSMATDEQERSSLFLSQSRCLFDMGCLKEARQCWTEAAARWDNLYVQLVDAYLCAEEGKSEEAISKLMLLLERYDNELRESGNDNFFTEAYEKLGYLLFASERHAEAIQPLKNALTFPQTVERKRQLCLYIGISYLETLDLPAAERSLIESVPSQREDPQWAKAHYQLGRLYFQRAAYTQAKEAFECCEFFANDRQMKESVSIWLARIAKHLPTKKTTN